ncbi:phage tail protein [Methylocystis sp. SB2]|uniref:phage tail protein n=1 Tax=Methylocystis sp. (strain SB2) TaxID=743836 RepID=UPI0004238234|nr:phage tail protein [Methylocystis sp. SB2]ULO23300.1 phage tail protein [Methylocystis sp. SB2]
MSQFTVNAARIDPYKNFKFRLKWDGRYVAGVSLVGPLRRTTEVIEYREGGSPSLARKLPGVTTFAPIVVERGVSHDLEFERWVNKVWSLDGAAGVESSLKDFRKDVVLELLNEAGQVAIAYLIRRCWPSCFEALPTLDANGSAVAIQRLVLENEGWERDLSVAEPVEPSYE